MNNIKKIYTYKKIYFYRGIFQRIKVIEENNLKKANIKKEVQIKRKYYLFINNKKSNKKNNKKITIALTSENNKILDDTYMKDTDKKKQEDREKKVQINENIVARNDRSKYTVKFCVFLGRYSNIKILHKYIELSLKNNIIDEYHMYDFSRNIVDHNFIYEEYQRLQYIYINRIFIHNYKENIIGVKREKYDWSPFYKSIGLSGENDIIIKCDDDILFIDVFSLENAINDRINDKESFLIHSNCINNGVCAYYQQDIFLKLKSELKEYPTGGLLGILFEKPELAYVMHNQFTNDLLKDFSFLNKYVIKDRYVNSRISINFILIRGEDARYLFDVSTDDEYELSSFYPEKLGRPNKIKGDLITSHLSYSFQEKVILNRHDIVINYGKIAERYSNLMGKIIEKFNENINIYIPKFHLYKSALGNKDENEIYVVKNWINERHCYIKNMTHNKYLYIDYENDELILDSNKKTIFEIIEKEKEKEQIEIKLGIYYITRYNSLGKIRNLNIFMKYFRDDIERRLVKEEIVSKNIFYLKFLKYNTYFSIATENTKEKWTFEKVNFNSEYINYDRFIKGNKIYYRNIESNDVYTNYYLGWGLENIIW